MEKSKGEKKKKYFEEGIKALLRQREEISNYKIVLEESKAALKTRKDLIDKLYDEIKQIKKLRV